MIYKYKTEYQLEKEWAINEKLQSQLKQERVYNSLDSRYSTFGKTNNY